LQGPRGFVSEHVRLVLGDRIADHHVYMCGPPPMLDATEKIVLGAGVLPANVHADKFLQPEPYSAADKPFTNFGSKSPTYFKKLAQYPRLPRSIESLATWD
jgi:ferredoxin-NADP reductase